MNFYGDAKAGTLKVAKKAKRRFEAKKRKKDISNKIEEIGKLLTLINKKSNYLVSKIINITYFRNFITFILTKDLSLLIRMKFNIFLINLSNI